MFDTLEDRFQDILTKLRGHSRLTEDNIKDALREVRLSLLEADVHLQVVKAFIKEVKERSLGKELDGALKPGQAFVQIVSEELTRVMGETAVELDFKHKRPAVILMMGLQGSGKTTTTGKLAFRLLAEKKKVLLVPADVHRPAAVQQLKKLAAQVGADAFDTKPGMGAVEAATQAFERAKRQGYDVVLVDTAGRLAIDLELMEELRQVKAAVSAHYSLLVVDAMTGQDAVNVAGEFKNQIGIDGVVMTKLDGDARGGAALSVRHITGAPIYFTGTGEKMDALEVFHPDRVARRILGMGDMLGLIERTQAAFDEKQAKKMAKKIKKADFTFEDFRDQMAMMRKMGDMKSLLNMVPGMKQAMKQFGAQNLDFEKDLRRIEAMISSMTPAERADPDLLNTSRRKRVALGSGHDLNEVNTFVKRFKDARKMMRKLSKMGPGGLKGMMRGLGGMGGGMMGGMGGMGGGRPPFGSMGGRRR